MDMRIKELLVWEKEEEDRYVKLVIWVKHVCPTRYLPLASIKQSNFYRTLHFPKQLPRLAGDTLIYIQNHVANAFIGL
jgi:hypothetical protein